MRLAFSTLGCPDWSVEQVIAAADESGYEGVELRLLGPEIIPADLPTEERARLRRQFEQAGVEIICVSTSARFAWADPAQRQENEQLAMRYLELAADLGSPFIRVFGGNFPEGKPEEQVVTYVAASLERVGRRGEELGVTTVLETHDDFSAGARVGACLAQVASRAVGALWDTHHPYRMGETPAQTLDYLGDRLRHLHVKDARRRGDGWDLVLLGEGEVPVAETLRVVQAAGYDGWCCVEWEKKWHPEIPDPAVALPQHARALRQMLDA
jgi:sugar phosphate isomerase/epimerase